MTERKSDQCASPRGPRVTAIATLPPPTTGQTNVTRAVVDALSNRMATRVYDLSGSAVASGIRWRIRKARRSLLSCLWMWRRPAESGERLYTVANDGIGLYYNLIIAKVARACGFHQVIHHHSFAYLHHIDSRMRRLVRAIGSQGTHVLLGDEMHDRFVQLYGSDLHAIVVPNYYLMFDPSSTDAESSVSGDGEYWNASRPMRLGHLSNLSFEKGVGRVIESFDRLRRSNANVELHLAGPPQNDRVRDRIERCVGQHGDAVRVYGPIYGDEKRQFFEAIDVFLFPTLYRTEAQPLVLIEAISAECPVVATDIACIPSLVGQGVGTLIDGSAEFSEACANQIQRWLSDPECYRRAVEQTRRRRVQIRAEAGRALETLLRECGAPDGNDLGAAERAL